MTKITFKMKLLIFISCMTLVSLTLYCFYTYAYGQNKCSDVVPTDFDSMERITDEKEIKRLDKYIRAPSNGGLVSIEWDNPSEIDADIILFYYDLNAMNGEGGEKYRKQPGIIVDMEADKIHVPSGLVYEYISRYMDYPLEKLKTGERYHAEKDDFDFRAFNGFGSAILSLEEVRKQGCYYLFIQKNLADQTISTMLKISGNEVRYLSNRIDGIAKDF